MSKFWIVAFETYKKQIKSIGYILMVIGPIAFMGIYGAGVYFASKSQDHSEIAIISQTPELSDVVAKDIKDDFEVDKQIQTKEEAENAILNDAIDGYLVLNEDNDKLSGNYVGVDTLDREKTQQIQQSLSQIQLSRTAGKLALSQADLTQLLTPATFNEKQIKVVDGKITDIKDNRMMMIVVGLVVSGLIYFIVLLYTSLTAQEVASEKGTRIMEVILSSTNAKTHFYGKITGVFLLILTQVCFYFVAGIVGYFFVKDMSGVKSILADISVGELLKSILGYNLLYLLFGVFIYTILAAFLGSVVSKAEDASKAVAPVSTIAIIGFMGGMFLGMSDPQNMALKVMSYIPFLSSFTMPIRIANNAVNNVEILISLAILVISAICLLMVAASAYRSTSLVYGDKGLLPTIKDALKLSK